MPHSKGGTWKLSFLLHSVGLALRKKSHGAFNRFSKQVIAWFGIWWKSFLSAGCFRINTRMEAAHPPGLLRQKQMNTKRILLASSSHFFCDLNTGSLPAILPFLISIHGLSYGAASALMLANSSLSSLIQPLFGYLSDRSSKLTFMPVGIAVAALGMSLLGFLESYVAIFLAVAMSGIGAALFHPAGIRFTNSVSRDKQGTATSIFSIGGNMGFLLAPLLAVFLIEHFGLKGLGVLLPIGLLMAGVLLYEMRSIACVQKKDIKKEREDACNNWHAFWRLTIAIIFRSAIMVCLRVFFPLYLIAFFHHSSAEAALALTIFGLSGIVGNILGGMLADRFGYALLVKASAAAMVSLLVVFPFLHNVFLIYLDLMAIALLLYASYSPIVVLGQKYLARNEGFSAGITLGLSISVGGLFSPLLGFLADAYGLPIVFHAFGFFGLMGALCSLFLPNVSGKK